MIYIKLDKCIGEDSKSETSLNIVRMTTGQDKA